MLQTDASRRNFVSSAPSSSASPRICGRCDGMEMMKIEAATTHVSALPKGDVFYTTPGPLGPDQPWVARGIPVTSSLASRAHTLLRTAVVRDIPPAYKPGRTA